MYFGEQLEPAKIKIEYIKLYIYLSVQYAYKKLNKVIEKGLYAKLPYIDSGDKLYMNKMYTDINTCML